MNLEFDRDEICLNRKQLLRVRNGSGHTIVCRSGSVWVTQVRDGSDTVLSAGESFTLDRDGLTLVQAFERSAISLVRSAPKARIAVLPLMLGRLSAAAGLARAAVGA